MRVLNAVQRTVMLLLLVPVVAICLDTVLRAFGARPRNPIVSTVRSVRDWFVLQAFTDVFPDQNYWQTALVALAAYGVLALVVVSVFRALRSALSARPPARREPAAAPKTERLAADDTAAKRPADATAADDKAPTSQAAASEDAQSSPS